MLNHVSPPSLPAGLALAPAEPPPFAWLPAGLAFLRRNLMLITLSALPCFGAGLGYVMLATSQYTATNTLVIDSRRTHPTRAQPINLDAQSENAFVESQVEVLRGQGTLRAVVDRLALDRDPRFWDPEAPQNPLQAGRAAVSALLRGPANMEGLAPGDEGRATAARMLARNLDIRRIGQRYATRHLAGCGIGDISAARRRGRMGLAVDPQGDGGHGGMVCRFVH
jgi:hypothetical protein